MTIKQYGGVFGRNPTFNDATIDGTLTVDQIVEKTGTAGITLDGVTLKDGNVVLADGKGIDFSATAGTGTSELFDDYEEGTWTPTVIGLTVVGTPTYTGRYTKVGRLVSFDLQIFSTTSTAATTGVTVFSLPFVQAGDPRSYGSCSVGSPSTAGILTLYIYPPTWGATQYVWISGTYSV